MVQPFHETTHNDTDVTYDTIVLYRRQTFCNNNMNLEVILERQNEKVPLVVSVKY